MPAHRAFAAFASAFLLLSCDGGMTGPSYEHLRTLSLAPTFACGVDDQGHAHCWGSDNARAQLGDGSNAPSATPVPVRTGARFLQVVTGSAHACGLTTEDRVLCWGDNTLAQLGAPTTDLDCNLLQSNGWMQDFGNDCSVVPVAVETGLRFVEIGAGAERTCGRTSAGAVWCWGSAYHGLGDSAVTTRSDSLIRVASPVPFTTLAVGSQHSCASDGTGQGWCWGSNENGALGRGTLDSLTSVGLVPEPINSSAFIRRWALGTDHTCALTGGGDALCWGRGSSGQRGDSSTGAARHDPTFVATALKFARIAAAGESTCALEAGSGAAWCWGENSSGQLGDGTRADRLAPAPVLGGLTFSRLVMGVTSSYYASSSVACGISGGTTYCWGLLPEPLTFEE